MSTTREEIILMKHRMDSMEDKLGNIESKLDTLTKQLLDPDNGVTARVNRNTEARKGLSRALWVLYGIVAASVAKLFLS